MRIYYLYQHDDDNDAYHGELMEIDASDHSDDHCCWWRHDFFLKKKKQKQQTKKINKSQQ